MKINFLSCLLSIGLVTVTSPSVLAQQVVVDFKDLNLPEESFYNGSDGANGFKSRGAFFNNSYNPTFGSWSGWSYSNTTDKTTPGFLNQYSAYTGGGFDGSSNYGVAFTFNPGSAYIDLPTDFSVKSAQITNTTYAVLSILNGDQFAKKFGGTSGNDPDFFLLTITGLDAANAPVGIVDFYLADYRFVDNSQDYIVNTWQPVDLSGLKQATRLSFALTSSDVGSFGLNTPAYFALGNLTLERSNATKVQEPSSALSLLAFGAFGASLMLHRKQKLISTVASFK
ncbi:MAG: DUF4465 domain-containing protein [Rhizonema sp. PD38]|nr:DUF4465 domain-containing protein [Rhizonema sp. PD38]